MNERDFHIELVAEPRFLKALRGLVRGYVNTLGFSHDRTEEVVLAVDEACSNSIRHSYAGERHGSVELDLRSDAREIVIELRDTGIPAPDAKIRPKSKTPEAPDLKTLRPGGLGVQLIYEVFDAVEFHPGAENGNHVIMRLRRPESPREPECKPT